jgi:hypothetical protein
MTEKRKVGRPKKTSTIVQEPKPGSAAAQRLELAMLYQRIEALEYMETEFDRMHAQVVQSLNAQLNEAYDQHTYMLSTIRGQLNYVMEHLSNIEYHAGSLTMQDVAASIDVLSRIMHNKFGDKSHQEEI